MIICNICKTENEDKNVVCKKCGTVIGDIPELDFTEIVKRKREKEKMENSNKKVSKRVHVNTKTEKVKENRFIFDVDNEQ